MKVFIDDFNLIRIESNVYIHSITIEGYHLNWYKNVDGNQYFKTDRSLLLHKNDHIWINYNKYPLYIGLVTLRDSFEKRFRYDGPLGYIYNKEFTEFFIFTPVAKEVNLVIGNKIYEMIYIEPIWYRKIKGDFELKPYHYQVRLVNEFHDVEDPYAIGYDSMNNVIVDLEKLNTTKTDYIKLNKYTDAVIYEGHVRDLTIDLDVEDRGTFSGL